MSILSLLSTSICSECGKFCCWLALCRRFALLLHHSVSWEKLAAAAVSAVLWWLNCLSVCEVCEHVCIVEEKAKKNISKAMYEKLHHTVSVNRYVLPINFDNFRPVKLPKCNRISPA